MASSISRVLDPKRFQDSQAYDHSVSWPVKVSMDRKAHYVTQACVYEGFFTGPLTDRRIAHYQSQGYYGAPVAVKTRKRDKARNAVSKARMDAFDQF